MTRSLIRRFTPPLLLVLLLAGGVAACEESVDPILESDRYFSLYGVLDMKRDTQYVRVEAVRPALRLTDAAPLDARVTSTDLVTGGAVAWRDSLVTFADGSYSHVFWAPFRVVPTHTYRLDVERADGAVTSAVTTVPPVPVPHIAPPTVTVVNTATLATQTIVWEDVPDVPYRTEVWYRFAAAPGAPFIDVPRPPGRTRMTEAGWEARVDLTIDRDSLQQMVGRRTLLGLGMTIVTQDTAWVPPGGVWDPEVLVQPGLFSNVEHGFGFVGAAGRFSTEWVLDPVTANLLGFPIPGKHDAADE